MICQQKVEFNLYLEKYLNDDHNTSESYIEQVLTCIRRLKT